MTEFVREQENNGKLKISKERLIEEETREDKGEKEYSRED